jgi:hypothetical protein
MPNGLYWEDWYDDPMLKQTVSVQDQGILYENRILGLPRLRQVRFIDDVVTEYNIITHKSKSVLNCMYTPHRSEYQP